MTFSQRVLLYAALLAVPLLLGVTLGHAAIALVEDLAGSSAERSQAVPEAAYRLRAAGASLQLAP